MNIDFADSRRRMVDSQLRTSDITSTAVLDVMGEVPREIFVPEKRRSLAYIDDDIEIAPAGGGNPARFLMEPSPFGRMLQAAAISLGDSVLDVGCGTGYGPVVISRLAGKVTALESDPVLAAQARANLAALGCGNVEVVEGPLDIGHGGGAPYDVILIEGAVERISDALLAQLAEGGRLVVTEGLGNAGVTRAYVKENGAVSGRRLFNAALRPLPGFAAERAFVF